MAGSATITGTQNYVLGIGHPKTEATTEAPPAVFATDPLTGGVTGLVGPDGGVIPLTGYYSDLNVNAVISGLLLPTSGTIGVAAITSGVAYVNNYRVSMVGTIPALTDSSDNYIDLSQSGVYTISPVALAAAAPAVAANSIRLGFVKTGALTITSATQTGKDSLGNWMGNRVFAPACILGGLTSQSIPSNTNTSITFGTTALEVFDNQGVHSISTNSHRISILQTGLYQLTGFVSYGTGGGNPQLLTIRKNADVSVPLFTSNSGLANTQSSMVAGQAYLQAGDFIYMRFNSITGVSLVEAYFSAVRIG